MNRNHSQQHGRAGTARSLVRLTLALAVLGILLPALPGCAPLGALFQPASPLEAKRAQYDRVKRAYTAVLTVLALARASDHVDDESWATVVQVKEGASKVFDEVEADLAAGKAPDYGTALRALEKYLQQLTDEQFKVEKAYGSRDSDGGDNAPPVGETAFGGHDRGLREGGYRRAA